MDEKIKEKCKKLNAVIGGTASTENEKQIARNILKKYEELGYDIEVSDVRKYREFPFKGGPKNKEKIRFLITILQNLMNDDDSEGMHVINNEFYNYQMELTESEYIEILTRFEFYWRDYQEKKKEHEEVFRRAYIGKNNLWAKPDNNKEDYSPITTEEMERDMKAQAVRNTFDRAEYHKRIGAANS